MYYPKFLHSKKNMAILMHNIVYKEHQYQCKKVIVECHAGLQKNNNGPTTSRQQ